MVVRCAFVCWYGGNTCSLNCSGAEDGVIVSFVGRDKTSSSELGAQLCVNVNLYTLRICDKNVLRDGYGNTCLVHVRKDAMSDFASSLTWKCWVHALRDVTSDVGPCSERCYVGFCLAWSVYGEMRCRILLGVVREWRVAGVRKVRLWSNQHNLFTERCDVEFLFVLICVVDSKTIFETSCAAVFMPWIQGWWCRLVARCVYRLTDGMEDFVEFKMRYSINFMRSFCVSSVFTMTWMPRIALVRIVSKTKQTTSSFPSKMQSFVPNREDFAFDET